MNESLLIFCIFLVGCFALWALYERSTLLSKQIELIKKNETLHNKAVSLLSEKTEYAEQITTRSYKLLQVLHELEELKEMRKISVIVEVNENENENETNYKTLLQELKKYDENAKILVSKPNPGLAEFDGESCPIYFREMKIRDKLCEEHSMILSLKNSEVKDKEEESKL